MTKLPIELRLRPANYVACINPSGIHVLKLVKNLIILFSQSFTKLNVPLVVAYLH